ncbi:MAG TPA: tRNA (adenosine(37)-N6)-threonylcarbamoyltransferase complex transferase subunit TsaD, partial [Acidobacteriaceae bacterium]|nr:tRNA (adenosine(37)-N6)-threonylcarbamoyltransferase complex transferase subunit TsaD [Acidobacteriaceae bacterium]
MGNGPGKGLILGIESSCDETAAAVVERGMRTLSSVVASQIATHAAYGGVVPELASREHLRNVVPVTEAALKQAGVSLADVDAIAVTHGPGLAGALLVGIMYAKGLAFALGKPLVAVNHLEGHIHAVLLAAVVDSERWTVGGEPHSDEVNSLPMPALALVVSGGHTHLYQARPPVAEEAGIGLVSGAGSGIWRYSLVGRTLDDAAGEAFDKVAKLLGLGYPGGPWIDHLAQFGDPHAVPFAFARIKEKAHLTGKTPRTKAAATAPIAELDRNFLFSFSGIKTAVLRYVEVHGMRAACAVRQQALMAMEQSGKPPSWEDAKALCDQQTLDLIASFQHAVVGDLLRKTFAAAEALGAASVLVTGGVAANRELRVRFTAEAADRGIPVGFPTLALATDNAAMIAAAAWPRFLAGEFAGWELEA